MIALLMNIALFFLILFFLLPLLIFSVYLQTITKHLHGHGHWHEGGADGSISR